MNEVSAEQLQQAVEGLHNCAATLAATVVVHERYEGQTVWHGVVHVFNLSGHPKAETCYAWSAPIEKSIKRKFYAVLKLPPIQGPADAVRATIVQANI